MIVWNVHTGEKIKEIYGLASTITALAFSPLNFDRLAAGDVDGNIKVWRIESGEEVLSRRVETGIVSLSYMNDFSIIYSDGRKVVVLEPVDGDEALSFPVVMPDMLF